MATLQEFQKTQTKKTKTSAPASRSATASKLAPSSKLEGAMAGPAGRTHGSVKQVKAKKTKNEPGMKKGAVAKRRPYQEGFEELTTKGKQRMETVKMDPEVATANTDTRATSAPGGDHHQEQMKFEDEPKKVEISFFGSEILRAKWKKPFDVAEKVATDWINGGNFENLEIGNPVADSMATRGLQKAKEVEKQVLESPAFEKVAVTALTWGMKLNQEVQNIRSQVKSKLGK